MKLRRQQTERIPPSNTVEAVAMREHSRYRFNPEDEIGEQDWHLVRESIHRARNSYGWYTELDHLSKLAVAFPKRKEELRLSDQTWQGAMGELDEKRANKDWHRFLSTAAKMICAAPERRDELNLNKDTEDQIIKWIDIMRGGSTWLQYTPVACSFLILFPDQRQRVCLDEVVWNEVRQEVSVQVEAGSVLRSAAMERAAILFPDRRHELGIDDNDWEVFQIELAKLRSEHFDSYLQLVSNLAVFSADQINISTQGVELVFNEKFGQQAELPTRNLS